MSLATSSVLAPDLLRLCDETAENAERLIRRAIVAVRAKVSAGDALSSELMEREQHACHGLAWLAEEDGSPPTLKASSRWRLTPNA